MKPGRLPKNEDGTESHRIRPDDWVCVSCNELIFAKKDSCRKCGGTRETTGILAKDADWDKLVALVQATAPGSTKPKPPNVFATNMTPMALMNAQVSPQVVPPIVPQGSLGGHFS